ncbi:Zinc finger in N-recognin family protein [Brugia malayi]|uniref:E3 ubiquitin-protein ligase n=1 Tax=Brugia malayi TaxID=6279 RepID=A0A0K0J9L4_BRUMA|nr:Zinc finger in N-recognin family protein [Brugia malayi]CRZ22963.1 Bm3285 [Brugia malayi]VIO94812.1 Zinc finger in N-recognin family protein [Brugia malayi]
MVPNPGDSSTESTCQSKRGGRLDERMDEDDWEEEKMNEAKHLKLISDELRAKGCPLFGGKYCDRLPKDIREKAGALEARLDSLISGSVASPFKSDTRDELRLLIAQGLTTAAFKDKMKKYDFSLKCNAVWSADAIAYRCNTCAFSPCMSLCSSCFKNSNHDGHDFNRFFSQAGGACDCGDVDVLNESGFCFRHGPNARRPPVPSPDIVSLGEFIIPKLFVRLFLCFRGWTRQYNACKDGSSRESFSNHLVNRAHILIELIQELVDCGGPIRDVIIGNLLDRQLYHDLNKRSSDDDMRDHDRSPDFSLDWRTRDLFLEDLQSLKPIVDSDQTNACYDPECLLDELIFWMVRLIFPQIIINLCLSLLSDVQYRDVFAKRFFSLYLCIADILVDFSKSEGDSAIYAIGSRIIHISVQILSSEAQCLKLDDEINLKDKIILSAYGVLKTGVQKSTVTQALEYFYENTPPPTNDDKLFKWFVYSVGDANNPLRKASYWTLVNDLQNLLTHGEIARRFFRDKKSMGNYVALIAPMQGMNLNYRVIAGNHLEYDAAHPYQLAFHLEWEVSAVNMFNTLAALTVETECMNTYLLHWKTILEEWFNAIGLTKNDVCIQPYCVSYHIPLHRHLSAGILRCIELPAFISCLNILIEDEDFLRKAVFHPLRIHVCRAEASAGMWARNGNAVRNQAFYYALTNYNIAFLDCDITLIKFIACFVDTEWFIEIVSTAFYVDDCLVLCGFLLDDIVLLPQKRRIVTRKEWVDFLIDGILRFLLDIMVIKWNMDGNVSNSLENEIVAALAVSDLTHSKLKAAIPERGSRPFVDDKVFDSTLEKLAVYCEPDQGSHIEQGVYMLTVESWQTLFDPVFCRMRTSTPREYNDALMRSENIERNLPKHSTVTTVTRSGDHLWIPYRLYSFDNIWIARSARFLVTPSFFNLLHRILYTYVEHQQLNEAIFQTTVYFLTLMVKFVTSKQFSCFAEEKSKLPSSVQEILSGQRNPVSAILSVFTDFADFGGRQMPSVITLLLEYLRKMNNENAISAEHDHFMAHCISKQLSLVPVSLDFISGYAIDYIGRLFCLLHHNCEKIRDVLDKFIAEHQVEMLKSDKLEKKHCGDSPSKLAHRSAAKRRQEALMIAHKKKNAILMKKLMAKEGLTQTQMDAMDTTENSPVRYYRCPICNDTTASTLADPIGLMSRIVVNYAVEHSLPEDCPSLSLMEIGEKGVHTNRMMLKIFSASRRSLLQTRFPKYADLIQAPTGIEVRTCGHYAHVGCYKAYVQTLLESPPPSLDPLEARMEISCPLCRAPVHTLLPLAPDTGVERIRPGVSYQENNYAELAKEVERLINTDSSHMQGNEESKFLAYQQLFLNFTSLCHKWTIYRGNFSESTPRRGQIFAFGLAKGNLERNLLLSESNFSDRYCRELPAEHIIYGARHQGIKRDISFIIYQWRQLVFGFHQKQPSVENALEEQYAEHLTPNDSDILASSTVEAKVAKMRMNQEIELETGTPMVMFDLKTTLIRISSYIITSDSLTNEDKKSLLSFVYQVILYAGIVRTAIVAALHMPLSQLGRTESLKLSNEVFTLAVKNVINRLFSRHLKAENILLEDGDEVDFEKALHYTCADLSRLTAQLWHECGIYKCDQDYCISRATFMEIYKLLTNNDELSLKFLPYAHIEKWVDAVLRWISCKNFIEDLHKEPLGWRRFTLLTLPKSYDDLFARFFGVPCIACGLVPRMPFICLLCGQLSCLDSCCTTSATETISANEVERHALICSSGVGCFLSLNTSLIVIVCNRKAALWGSVYLDAHGEEDRNLRRGKPLFLSKRRIEKLTADWMMQSFEHLIVNFFNFDDLISYLRDAHYMLQ